MAFTDRLRHASIKTLFLVDAIGATLSTFTLGGVLIWYNTYIGMPVNILQFLAGFALIFALYSWTCFFVPRFQTPRTIGIITKSNLAYIILTLILVIYHFQALTFLGIAYFVGEDHDFYAQLNGLDSIQHVLIGYLEDQPVACGALRAFSTDSVEIKRMYTRAIHRGRGYAQFVLTALEAWAAEFGYSRCILETGLKQPQAIRLYRKAGYAIIPNYEPYAGDENSQCFAKNILS